MRTICEHPQWLTTAGRYKLDSCGKAPAKLEARGLIKLPPKRPSPAGHRPMVVSSATDPGKTIVGSVRGIEPVAAEPMRDKEIVALWNEYVHRYHPLSYKRPFGAHERYFIRGAGGRLLGCLLFASSAWALAERDRARRLNWVLANTRFLLFPGSRCATRPAKHGRSPPRASGRTGTSATVTGRCFWKLSWMQSAMPAHAIGQPTGSAWGDGRARAHGPRGAALVDAQGDLRLPAGCGFSRFPSRRAQRTSEE